MIRRPLWWIWTLAHIMIFSKFIILKIERVHPVSSFPSRKVFALVSGSPILSQVVGRVATISVSWHLNYRSATEISCICIYQVDHLADCHPPFRSTHLMTYGILTGVVSGIPLKSQVATSSSVIADGRMITGWNFAASPSHEWSQCFQEIRRATRWGAVGASSLRRHCLMISSASHPFFPTNVWPWSPCLRLISMLSLTQVTRNSQNYCFFVMLP